MKPLLVLLAVFGITALILSLGSENWDAHLAGRIAMSAMLFFTAFGHFVFTSGMALMLPEKVPFRRLLVYLTGILEILFAIGLLMPSYQTMTAWLLIIFLIVVLPANIFAAFKKLNYQKATYEGKGVVYLWFRIPLQAVFIGWVFWAAL